MLNNLVTDEEEDLEREMSFDQKKRRGYHIINYEIFAKMETKKAYIL